MKHADSGKSKDFLDQFFDSLVPGKSSNSEAIIPSKPTTTKEKKIRLKPYRVTYRNQQMQLMALQSISKSLEEFRQKCQHKSCCKRECYSKLNEQMIVYCRSQYVLLPSFKERRVFLAEHQKRKPDGSCWNAFWVQKSDGDQVKVCRTAWLLAYGISEGMYKKRNSLSQQLGANKRCKTRRDGSSTKEMLFVEWLKRQAEKIGCKLPHGDGVSKSTQIRLPYPSKQIVWFLFDEYSKKKILVLENLKNAGLSYEDATQLWKHHPELSHIKLIRCKGSFGKCKVCLAYELKIQGKLSVAEREKADMDFLAHIAETKKERAQYAKDQIKCSEEA